MAPTLASFDGLSEKLKLSAWYYGFYVTVTALGIQELGTDDR